LLIVVTTKNGRKVLVDLKIDIGGLFAGLSPDQLPKLSAFLEKRLPRMLAASN
jgi:hypothetical protein